MFKFNVAQLNELKQLTDRLNDLEGTRNQHPLTAHLLECLLKDYYDMFKFSPKVTPDHLFNETALDACCCTGARDTDPYCGCIMMTLRYKYRYDIALAVLEREK